MKIAVIGAGVSGLVAAERLRQTHDVTVFEAGSYIGGHTNTIDVESPDGPLSIDTGFIVFNDRTYPNFIKLLDRLNVPSQDTIMSFSVKCERTGLEYRGADPDGLFAQRRNLFNPKFYRLLYDLMKFFRLGEAMLDADSDADENETVGSFLNRNNFSSQFVEQYFLPMGAAIWSASYDSFRDFPIRFIAEFYKNHGLLGVKDRPQWKVVQGGSKQYVKALTHGWTDQIKLNSPVQKVVRNFTLGDREPSSVTVTTNGQSHEFDHVVFACHSDQALRMLGGNATESETGILSAFPYQKNVALLHTQSDVLPKQRRAWASWNYFNPIEESDAATVTYNMNILQSLNTETVWCVTLNGEDLIRDENIVASIDYAHPTFSIGRKAMQARHAELCDANATSFCGAYWGNGFHEDGVVSGLRVVEALQQRANTSQPSPVAAQ
ncbi:NAD(P)/FAD-dependent oxidoreductase [Mariniblastus fucicola]|uniref:Amine oxidase domain-containing protein n=1 Tax=Mariniblastus fucicola TaxID=980251 RepID=A0A5B9P8X4_9BACT|nr:FAD-dependent oxidoreductase [Mariniblastus fucicola]QEG21899.1 hypothetical protein MFFC18_17600 [Mariniblastus fucicola]